MEGREFYRLFCSDRKNALNYLLTLSQEDKIRLVNWKPKSEDNTILHQIARDGNEEGLDIVMSYIDARTINHMGDSTPLVLSLKYKNTRIAERLVECDKIDLDYMTKYYKTQNSALHYAALYCNHVIFEKIIALYIADKIKNAPATLYQTFREAFATARDSRCSLKKRREFIYRLVVTSKEKACDKVFNRLMESDVFTFIVRSGNIQFFNRIFPLIQEQVIIFNAEYLIDDIFAGSRHYNIRYSEVHPEIVRALFYFAMKGNDFKTKKIQLYLRYCITKSSKIHTVKQYVIEDMLILIAVSMIHHRDIVFPSSIIDLISNGKFDQECVDVIVASGYLRYVGNRPVYGNRDLITISYINSKYKNLTLFYIAEIRFRILEIVESFALAENSNKIFSKM